MVQELQVVRCFSCETFQTQIVKKTNKWDCKVCGLKQSIKKVYARGSGKDCRIHTQKLNALKGSLDDSQQDHEENDGHRLREATRPTANINNHQGNTKSSKWAEFIEVKNVDEDYCDDYDNRQKEIPNERSCKGSSKKKRKYDEQKPSVTSSRECKSFRLGESSNNFYSSNKRSSQEISVKRFKTDKNVNTDNVYNNLCDNELINDDVCSTVKSSNERERSQKSQVKSVGKWGKYLEIMQYDENSQISSGNIPESEPDDSTMENFTSPKSFHSKKAQISTMQASKLNNSDVDLELNGSVSLNLFNVHCESNSLKEKISADQVERSSYGNPILPRKMFEQECDLSDIDLELDF